MRRVACHDAGLGAGFIACVNFDCCCPTRWSGVLAAFCKASWCLCSRLLVDVLRALFPPSNSLGVCGALFARSPPKCWRPPCRDAHILLGLVSLLLFFCRPGVYAGLRHALRRLRHARAARVQPAAEQRALVSSCRARTRAVRWLMIHPWRLRGVVIVRSRFDDVR